MTSKTVSLFSVLLASLLLFQAACPAQTTPTLSGGRSFNLEATTTDYAIGPGDGLQINFFNVPELSGARTVLPDGTLSMPLLGSVRGEGLTADQLTDKLAELYRPYLVKTRISVTIERPRPVTITVSGEVYRPGAYTSQPVQTLAATGGVPSVVTNRINVSSVLAQAGGVTERADVRNVTFIRQMPNGQTARRSLDLWALIQNGDVSQNPVLQDGDALVVAEAGTPNLKEYGHIASSNLSPESIEVQVVGEVQRPGAVKLRGSSPLIAALQGAGGLTNLADPTRVELLRINRDGSVSHRLIDAKVEQALDEQKNPPLRDRDMLIVRRSFGGEVVTGISTVLGPITQLSNILLLFRALR
ncbi:polysaccharide biosynthesis/export family protein [Gloeobacter morelensis]|uniref:SLBB domain-containing protein n=1 Tax=Gloeobacter morelensis MG652769 TaxID=2781736 RepID=A0ABY3PQT7_9CYAN|nr:polysaccharide biosynthesis/export family protein [Gloeobacter morelensis]UFP95974.1 SLBB domain-containing protein [Gloeobacter morelensis MG652769]